MAGPLAGIRVAAIGDSAAVGMAAWLLAQMGAAVTWWECAQGTDLRNQPPLVNGESALFAYLGANTSSRLISDDGLGHDFDAHVILHDRVRFPEAWTASLKSAPLPDRGCAVVACTPYGQDGPHSGWLGTEVSLFQAGGEGFLMPSGLAFEDFPKRPPIGVGRYVAHYQCGIAAAVAAVAGLRSSRLTEEIEWVDCGIQDAELSLNYFTVARFVDGVAENRASRAFKYGGVLQCRDGFVELLTLEQRQWENLRSMLGDPSWSHQAHLEEPIERGSHGDEINGHLRDWASERTIDEVVEAAASAGVPCGPYLAPEQLMESPQLRARGFFTQADPGEGTGGLFPGSPWHIEGWSGVAHEAAPRRPNSDTKGTS